jgi:DNA polymerase-1
VVIAFDTAEPTFRHEADEAYKAHREVAPQHFFDDLANLQAILRQALDLPLCMAPGYEADDVLGTLAVRAAAAGWRVRILSGDRDLFQLVDDELDIAVLYMGGGPYAKNSGPTEIRREAVIARLGVPPEDVVDLKALTGDSSDNIPGVKGVGPKTAITLLKAHGDLDGIYAALDQQKATLKSKLEADRDNAYRSRMLAAIHCDVPLPESPRLELGEVNTAALTENLKELELFTLVRQAEGFASTFSAHRPRAEGHPPGVPETAIVSAAAASSHVAAHADMEHEPAAAASAHPDLRPLIVTSPAELETLITRLMAATDPAQPVALDTETTSLNPFRAELLGIGVGWGSGPDEVAYIPIGHRPAREAVGGDASAAAPAADLLTPLAEPEPPLPAQLCLDVVLTALAAWLASTAHPKTLQNAKYDRLILMRHGLALHGVVMDTMLADYLRDANDKHGLEAMAERNFGFTPTGYKELVPKGATFAAVPIEAAALYCGMDVHLTWRLTGLLREQLEALGPALPGLLEEVELPLEPVLAAMEATGIRIDLPYLKELSEELGLTLNRLEAEAKQAAGVDFNLASPKQLGELLFDTLGLERRKSRKTKTGWSTDAAVLEKLEDDHPVVPLVLEHRTLSKLRSTYVDALPALVEP